MRRLVTFLGIFISLTLIYCTPKKGADLGQTPNPLANLGEYKAVVGTYGGSLRLTTTSPPKTFNNLMAKETSTTDITRWIFEGLTNQSGITTKVEPWLASTWDISSDGLTYTFHLRKNVKWFDGKPFTADDVVFTFNDLIFNEKIPSSSADTFTIDGKRIEVSKVDDLTVNFKLATKFAPFLQAMGTAIYPKHKLEKFVKEGTFASAWGVSTLPVEIVGTGPFVLSKYVTGQRVELKRNPNYWQKDDAGNVLPYLDGLEFTIVQNSDVELLKFKNDETDFYSVRGQDYPTLKPLEAEKNFTIYNAGPAFGSQFLVVNQNKGKDDKGSSYVPPHKLKWFTNVNFRKALAYAIDKQSIINIELNGLGYDQWGPESPSAGFFFSSDLVTYPYNLDKARDILKGEGFVDRNSDGFLEDKEGNPVEFVMITNADNTERKGILEIIRKDFEKLGIKAHISLLEFNSIVSKLFNTYDWDIVLIGLTGGIEPHFGSNIWKSEAHMHMWYPKQKEPATAWEKRINEIFSQGVQELDPDKRKKLYDEWQKIVSDNLPVIYTVLSASISAMNNKFGNVYPTPFGGTFHNIERIYVKKKS